MPRWIFRSRFSRSNCSSRPISAFAGGRARGSVGGSLKAKVESRNSTLAFSLFTSPGRVSAGVGAFAGAVTVGGVVVVVIGAAVSGQTIENNNNGATAGAAEKEDGTLNGVARSAACAHD